MYDGSDDNETTHNNGKGRPGYNHASSTGTGGAVVGTCNENFFKPIAKKNMVNDSPPVPNIGSQVTKAKQRRFRVESSDRYYRVFIHIIKLHPQIHRLKLCYT